MSFLSSLSKPIARMAAARIKRESINAAPHQERILKQIVRAAQHTAFGTAHEFSSIHTYADFVSRVPVRDYEGLKEYIDRTVSGERDVLWQGKPMYLSKTSGTTSGVKYIPITKESLPNHLSSTRRAMFCYIAETGRTDFLAGNLLFISGSPALSEMNGIKTGRLSGIVNHHIPSYLKRNQLPSWETNCMEDFEEKIEHMMSESIGRNLTLLSGIPPWVQMYLDRIMEKTGVKVKEVFPNLSLFIYGGVHYEPYRKKFEESIGSRIDTIELYPASEGFIAFQDRQGYNDLLLCTNSGIFFEFIPSSEYFSSNPKRIALKDVEPDVNYAIILSSNAGLWAYSLGDTVRFTSVNPYRLVVTGRVKHYISAFGEHVIGEEVEKALQEACHAHRVHVVEFTVSPQVNPPEAGLPYHEWFIEFDKSPEDIEAFRHTLDASMQQQNTYYLDLVKGHVLQPLKVTPVRKGAFIDYMRSKGKLGGQNKVPRLANDRTIADELQK